MPEEKHRTMYYPINEDSARRAKEMNSFSDYKLGSATEEYRRSVDEAAALAERQKARVDPMYHEKIDRLLDTYARKLAENMNEGFAIDTRVPSILIAGGSNFPVRKKEKQNAARDRNMDEWRQVQGLLDKIRSTGMGGINADDPSAITKLESKLGWLGCCVPISWPKWEWIYALVEADRIGGGITKNTTAKITSQHGLIYDKLVREFGTKTARIYLQANLEALGRSQELCRDSNCDFEEKDAFVYSRNDRRKIERETAALERLWFPVSFETELPLPFPIAGAVRFPRQAQFHPLKFLGTVARNLRIFEHTKVLELMPGKARTTGGTVFAKKIIISTHFPILNKHGGYFLKLYQQRSYVLALEGAPGVNGMYVDEQDGGLSFRNYQGRLLLGGDSHRTGKPGDWEKLKTFVRQNYPQARIAAKWTTQDCISLDGVPYIGQYAKSMPGLYVAAGSNKWGMISSMVAAVLLADLVSGRESKYAPGFQLSRKMLRPQLAVNGREAVANLLTPTVPSCPHMGCALKYNADEHSWDCPCHGSRFGEDWALLDNPATDDKRI